MISRLRSSIPPTQQNITLMLFASAATTFLDKIFIRLPKIRPLLSELPNNNGLYTNTLKAYWAEIATVYSSIFSKKGMFLAITSWRNDFKVCRTAADNSKSCATITFFCLSTRKFSGSSAPTTLPFPQILVHFPFPATILPSHFKI